MADAKISALTNLTAADAINDMIPIVDVSDTPPASGNTKRISINNILSSSPTASGALTVTGLVTAGSATITGAATVGTTLGVTGVSTLTGAVGVGATPIGKFDVYNTVSDTTVFIRSDTTKLGQIVFRDNADAGNQGKLKYDHLTDTLSLSAGGNENLFLSSTGDLSVTTGNVVMATSGKGIDFSATASGSGTMTSELLADYEEGTFTPTVGGSTTAGVGVYTVQTGRYTKVGRLVTVEIHIGWSAHTGTGNIRILSLPFTVNAVYYSAATIGFITNIALSASNTAYAFNEVNTTFINIVQSPVGGGSFTDVPMDVAGTFIISSTYSI
jgi:hypothetical protein